MDSAKKFENDIQKKASVKESEGDILKLTVADLSNNSSHHIHENTPQFQELMNISLIKINKYLTKSKKLLKRNKCKGFISNPQKPILILNNKF